jgi:putative component of membrane protein insertase Oxa1/YidC/SpoIIIJ protein YidD
MEEAMHFILKVLLLYVLMSLVVIPPYGICGEMDGVSPRKNLMQNSDRKDSSEPNIGAWLVSIFRDHISAVDGDRCPSLPSCAAYSVQAFRKHGFFVGWMMTVDRLIHEGKEETAVSPLVYYKGKLRIYDPVENNDFWWYGHREKGQD